MKKQLRKILSLMLVALMLISAAPVSVFAAGESVKVEIVSFMRGAQTDLRSSELLEARVTGYDGNVRELTYKWYNNLSTYLYVYNSHNMYNINNSDNEQEIHNTTKELEGLSNMPGRTHDQSFEGVGFAWASIYGANLSNGSALAGTIKVEVYDQNGTLLCSDTHEGKYAKNTKKNTGIVMDDLDADMDNVVIGLFVGDKRNVLDLLGESAIVHITCTASTVNKGKITSGGDYIKLTQEDGDYYITGTKAGTSTGTNGDAQVQLIIKKENCKFHNDSEGDAVTTVFVFKKPTTSTTTTTLTLTGDIDERCEYFIGGNKGERQADGTIVFTGLTPNTAYTVEVRGEYTGKDGTTKYAYAYVYDTTKPVYQATVNTYLDNVKTDISDIHGEDVTLYLHEDKENAKYIELTKTATGTYTTAVENGAYYPWHIEAGDHFHQAREYKLVVENANAELNLHHFSVKYDTNGGAFRAGEDVATENYTSMTPVVTTDNIPYRDGYVFLGWEYDDKIYGSEQEVTSAITAPMVLVAQWEKSVNVTINVTINHTDEAGGYDHNETKDELQIDFLEMKKDYPAFIETGDKLFFTKEKVTDEKDNAKDYTIAEDKTSSGVVLETRYTANVDTYQGLAGSSTFGVALSKSGYDVKEVKKSQDDNGNWTIDVTLRYNPDDFDLEFSVEMAEDVPVELYPDAVIVKIACWDEAANQWNIISQQRTTESAVRPGVRVDIDKATGKGYGSYPVWKYEENGEAYGYRAVVAGFIYNNSTVIVPTEKDHTKDENTVVVTYTDGNYTATMGEIADGKRFSTSLNGAYYGDNAQQGTLDGVITVEKYDVTFDAMGGTFDGADSYIEKDQYYIPELKNYTPTMDEHGFMGWYLDEAYTTPATEGELLVEDITLYARWDRILTGTVIVDGNYKDGDNQLVVDDADRTKSAFVELQEITPNGGTYNIAGQTVEITWNNGGHYSDATSYKFTGLDPNKNYRVNVYLANYDAAFQNSTTVYEVDGDLHEDYNKTDYEAVYPANSLETFVNIFLDFNPESYIQYVEVDTKAIGEGHRPGNALVQYFSQEVGTASDYVCIIQHTVEPYGLEVGLDKTEGTNDAEYGENVWKKNYNGNLYDYQASLTKLDGKDLSEWPVFITYGDPARWSPINQAPTGTLKVNVIPKWYGITYDFGYEVTDENGKNVNYKEVDGYGHIWSYQTNITYKPERVGYKFIGWYDNAELEGTPVTSISADVHENITLYAKWEERSDCVLKVYHVVKETGYALGEEVKTGYSNGKIVSLDAINKPEYEGYTYESASADSVEFTADNQEQSITLYYTKNQYKYTFNFIDADSKEPIADSVTGSAFYGSFVTQNAVEIKGYTPYDESGKIYTPSGTIYIGAKDDDSRVYNFYYVKNTYDYTVNYLEEGTGKALASAKLGTGVFGSSVTEEAAIITGYTLVGGTDTKSITIDTENNVINFYYKAKIYNFTVNYLLYGTNEVLGTVNSQASYGTLISETAKEFEGYSVVGHDNKSLTIDTAEENNVINFYYKANSYSYTVYYLEQNTGKELHAPKIAVADYGTKVLEFANTIYDYVVVGHGSETITIGTKDNEIVFYYLSDIISDKDDNSDGVPDVNQKPIYIVEHYCAEDKVYKLKDIEYFTGDIDENVTATAKTYDGYVYNAAKSTVNGKINAINGRDDILRLRLYYDIDRVGGGESGDESDGIADDTQKKVTYKVEGGTWADGTDTPKFEYVTITNGNGTLDSIPELSEAGEGYEAKGWYIEAGNVFVGTELPSNVSGTNSVVYVYKFKEIVVTPEVPENPDAPEGDIEGDGEIDGDYDYVHKIVFGKTNAIGWYNVSLDGGETYQIVFGNSTLEVDMGTEVIIKAGDLIGGAFTFYVNGDAVKPDENGEIRVVVDGAVLIGALALEVEVPDPEESLNWFQKIIKAIKDFFAKLFGKK